MDNLDSVSLDQVKAGYVEEAEHFVCLCCGERFEKGIIYPADGRLYEAGRYIRRHTEEAHGSVFEHLIGLDKSVTGLTDLQKRLLALFYQGKSDAEVQRELGMGSTSTIRNHRFMLKEKERQAKAFLAVMELLRGREPAGAPAAADRKPHRPGEADQVLTKYFPFGTDGPLKTFAIKESHRLIVLAEIAKRFSRGRRYTEQEVSELLEAIYADFATLRRYLVDYGFMDRLPDGSQYWLSDSAGGKKEKQVDRKTELKRLAKETNTEAGVYAIKNNRNDKLLIESTRNLKTMNGKRFELENGVHRNQALQQDWNAFGAEAFTFEVLEVLEKPDTGYFDEQDALAKLHTKWLAQLQPYGDRGYNPWRSDE